jgi:hypothetical protein
MEPQTPAGPSNHGDARAGMDRTTRWMPPKPWFETAGKREMVAEAARRRLKPSATQDHRVSRRVLGGVLLVAALMCGCTTGSGTATTSTTSVPRDGTSSSVDVAVVVRLQTIGPSGRTPADVARVAGAVGCASYLPSPPVPAGPSWEIHLRIPAKRLVASVAALHQLQGVSEVSVAPLSAFSAAPSARAGGSVGAIAC